MADKGEIYNSILNASIELEVSQGHLKWSYSDLSRKSHVTRSLIYYYFGKSKMNILLEACRLFGDEIAGLGEEKMQAWERGDFSSGLKKTWKMVKRFPKILPFYYLNRNNESEISKVIADYEKAGKRKMKKFYPNLTSSQTQVIQSLQLGLLSENHLTDQDFQFIQKTIENIINSN